jgi:hypothetical protein
LFLSCPLLCYLDQGERSFANGPIVKFSSTDKNDAMIEYIHRCIKT